MDDLFVIESVRPEIRLYQFLAVMILLLPARGGWFILSITAIILLIPLMVNSLYFHFQPAQIEIRFAPTDALHRLFPGRGRVSSGNPLVDWHRNEEMLAQRRGIWRGRCVKTIPRSRIVRVSYTEGKRFGAILIELRGCKPRTEKWLWLYQLRNIGNLYVIHTSNYDQKVGTYLRQLENF